jgi:NAD(P)-dependent dehydrogenase (short-subunit alcohol dehydrogenase family)
LLTGAAGGIGAAISSALTAAGHRVSAVDRDADALSRLQSRLKTSQLYPVVADLRFEEACREAVASTISHFGAIDAVINNVGIGVSSIRPDAESRHPTIEELSTEIWDTFFAINVRAAMIVTRAAVPGMKTRGWGRIINNTTSYRTMLRVLPYGATKSALESMSSVWATELAEFGITVNVLVPGGPTDTGLIAKESGWPRDRFLSPEVMETPARWLLSNDSNVVTGQRITAKNWDVSLPGSEAVLGCMRPIGWPELADKPADWQTGR